MTTGLPEDEAVRVVAERLTMVSSLFSNLPSPYPGMVTNTVGVADEMLPQQRVIAIGGIEVPLLILMSSARYGYGALTEEMAAFRGGLFFLYDRAGQTLYRFDVFIPKMEFREESLVAFASGITLVSGEYGVVGPSLPTDPAESSDLILPEQVAVPQLSVVLSSTDAASVLGRNLILIAFEPLGANHVSAYGYSKKTTPNFDAFARESYLFKQAVSPSSWSLPVFMSWFTSLYPSRHKVINKYSTYTEHEKVLANLVVLSPGVATMAQVLRGQGYRTAAFTGDASLDHEYGFDQGFEEYFDEKRFGGFDLTMPLAVQWLEGHPNEKKFLFVQGYDVHGQYPLNRERLGQFLDPPYLGMLTGSEEEYWQLRDRNLDEGGVSLSQEDVRLWRAVYDAKIFEADRRFGDFIDELRRLGLMENSIVIVSSGSGNEYYEHSRIDHGFSLYNELIRVPLAIKVPGEGGRGIGDQVRTIDLMPTAFDLLGISSAGALSRQMQGVSLVPLMAGKHLELDAVSETDYLQRSFKRAITTHDGWKLIVSLDSEKRELYNLQEDPDEQHNLAGDQGRLVYELEQRLFKISK